MLTPPSSKHFSLEEKFRMKKSLEECFEEGNE